MTGFQNYFIAISFLLSILSLQSCNVERYRTDHNNKLTSKAKKSQHYLSKQAKIITAKNIRNKAANFKDSEKQQASLQAGLNVLNKPKSKKNYGGKFSVY